ncbi:hypothetical protein GCM10009836_28600 [Pseudonocardia ailaonensis]|uniref:DUF6194 domain-containing protein n=1 Tax=Pseudonocardia ailaonensis TaxID=367279 RepID=A0ABN2N0N7_9PSEU
MDTDDLRPLVRPGTRVVDAGGDVFALHDPRGDLPPERQIPWATIVTSAAWDTASDLGRPGVIRLNLGLTRARYRELDLGTDLTALDVLLPHPEYAGRNWVCVLNPDTTLPLVRELADVAHAFAVRKHGDAAP